MAEIILDNSGIDSFLTPGGADDPIVSALRRRQYFQTIKLLSAIHDKITEDCPDLALRTGFAKVFSYIKSCSIEVQQKVLEYPTVAFWVEVTLDLLRRHAHVKFPELHIHTHLESFGRIGLAMAYFSKDSFVCNTRLDSAAGVFLPGISCYYSAIGAKPFELVRIKCKERQIDVRSVENRIKYSTKYQQVPRIANFDINTLDEDLRLPGKHDFEFDSPLRDSDLIRWQSPLEEGCNWICVSDSRLASEIETAIKAILPVRSKKPDVHVSATFKETPGVMALSWTPDTPVLTEALVHEYHHGKLNTLFAIDPLVTGPTKEPIFYSPWRTDARPLVGLLHGAFAFHAVLDFWIKFLNKGIPLLHEKRLNHRLCLLSHQTKEAVETLTSEGTFTKVGMILIESLHKRVCKFESQVLTDRRVLQRVGRVMRTHRENWEKQNGQSDPRVKPRTMSAEANSGQGITKVALTLIEDLATQFPCEDPIIEDLTTAEDQGRLESALDNWVQISTEASMPMLEILAGAHAAYVKGRFDEAGSGYGVLIQRYPESRYFWQCFGHCLRHLNKIDLGTSILTNLTRLSAEAQSHEPNMMDSINERTFHAKKLLASSDGATM